MAAAGVALVLLTGGIWLFAGRGADRIGDVSTARVTRGDLVITVTEGGEIEAKKRLIIRNELRWPVIIKRVVKEGRVSAGTVIIEFECKQLLDAIEQQKLQVTQAESNYEDASQNLELKREEVKVAQLNSKQAVTDAEEDLLRYEEGQCLVDKDQAEANIELAQRDLELAKSKLQFKLDVNDVKKYPELKSPYSQSEIKADELNVKRLERVLTNAVSKRDMLIKYDHPRQLRRFKQDVANAGLNLKRAAHDSERELRKATTLEIARKSTLAQYVAKAKELKEEAEKLVVTTKHEGLVVYNTGRSRRQAELNVDVGEQISPRQQLIIIPDMTTLQVKTKVYESRYAEVHPGLKAYIRLGSRPDEIYIGTVSAVEQLPDRQNWFMPGVKVFGVEVTFDKRITGDIKPGMTAQVQLKLATLRDVLRVPVAAVFARHDETYCWVLENGRPKHTEVTVGRMSDTEVEIKSGLTEGQEVLLAPPPGERERVERKKRTEPKRVEKESIEPSSPRQEGTGAPTTRPMPTTRRARQAPPPDRSRRGPRPARGRRGPRP